METAKYKASDAKRRRRLRQFAKLADAEDLRGEMAAARLLAQEALEAGNVGTANLILATVGKLAHSNIAIRRAKSDLLERGVVLRLLREIVDTVAGAVQGRFDGWETVLAQVADTLTQSVKSATNDKPAKVEALPE